MSRVDPPRPNPPEAMTSPAATRVVTFPGALDISTRQACYDAIMATPASHVVLDLAATTFMDCGGYRAIVAARNTLQGAGLSLHLIGGTGEPAFFLHLIAQLEKRQ